MTTFRRHGQLYRRSFAELSHVKLFVGLRPSRSMKIHHDESRIIRIRSQFPGSDLEAETPVFFTVLFHTASTQIPPTNFNNYLYSYRTLFKCRNIDKISRFTVRTNTSRHIFLLEDRTSNPDVLASNQCPITLTFYLVKLSSEIWLRRLESNQPNVAYETTVCFQLSFPAKI